MYTGLTYVEALQKLFEEAKMDVPLGEKGVKTKHQYNYPREEPLNGKEHVYAYLGKRGISKETIDQLDVREDPHGNIAFNYYDTNDTLCMVKYRPSHKIHKETGEIKSWCQKGADTSPLLFNMNRVNSTQPLLIAEGEIDSLAAIESGFTNAVSVPFGAGNFTWIEENFEWLEQFDSIIICSDNDEAGIKMQKECVYRLGSWRTKVVDIPHYHIDGDKKIPMKDLNHVLYYEGKQAVLDLIQNAKDSPVDSVSDFSDISNVDLDEIDGVKTGIPELDRRLMKLFYGTLTIVTGVNGCVSCDTEYFNGKEWKPISEYEEGDKVLQYNEDGTAELVFPEKYHIKPNYNLKKSITKIAVKLSGTVAKPNRTHLRYLDCTNAYINSNWELLQPHLESLRNINTIKDEKGKKVGFEIFIGPEGSEPWIADKKGDVSGIFEGRSKKRNLKKEIEQEKRFQEQETRFLEQNSMTFHVLPSSPEIDFDFNSYTSDYEMGLFADEFDTFDDI